MYRIECKKLEIILDLTAVFSLSLPLIYVAFIKKVALYSWYNGNTLLE